MNAPRRRRDPGSILVVGAVGFVLLLGFAALGVEATLGWLAKIELQNGLDAATKAGAFRLDGTDAGVVAAKATARDLASRNTVAGSPIVVALEAIEAGHWTATTGFAPGGPVAQVNALRLVHQVDVGTGFANAAFAVSHMSPAAASLGVRVEVGAGVEDCFLPVTVPLCVVEQLASSGTLEDLTFVFGSSGLNNAAWIGTTAKTPSAAELQKQIADVLTGACEDHTVAVGDTLGLNNGEVSSALKAMADAVSGSSQVWDPGVWGAQPERWPDSDIPAPAYGHVLEAPIVIVDVPGFCAAGGGPLSGKRAVAGFVKAALYDVHWKGGAAPTKRFALRLDGSTYTEGEGGGGPNYGIVSYVTSNPVE